ncbi:receptor-like protein kinase FERONIA, partial [Tanacetum coccineum]
TQNFDDKLVVGRGGFGKVYKGDIKNQESDGTIVAIKRLDATSDQGAPEFVAEIEMLSRLRHAHLVSLLGCCVDDKEMIIVYEYMPNGTVYHHLHKGTKHGVVHRHVKSSNILLDEDWEARISDFGLAKICPINQSRTYDNTRIKGTFGYLDPRIFLSGKLARKTDVFAFGVVMFELLSGRHAVLPDGDEDLSSATWAQSCVRKRNLDKLVSVEIRGHLSPRRLKEFAQISYRCLDSDPKKRPTMSEVVVALQLSETLQEKFDNSAKPSGLFGFTWKIFLHQLGRTLSRQGPAKSTVTPAQCPPQRMVAITVKTYTPSKPGVGLKIFSYTDLKHATYDFITPSSSGQNCSFIGWVHEKSRRLIHPQIQLLESMHNARTPTPETPSVSFRISFART